MARVPDEVVAVGGQGVLDDVVEFAADDLEAEGHVVGDLHLTTEDELLDVLTFDRRVDEGDAATQSARVPVDRPVTGDGT